MKKSIGILSLLICSLSISSQESQLIQVDVLGNKVAFKQLIHASIYFEINAKTIYVDPWGEDSLYKGLKTADAIILTDIHPDHYSVENIEKIMNENTFFIAPMAVYEIMPEDWKNRCSVLHNDENINFDNQRLEITAIPMYNTPEKDTQPHIKGRGNGYILDVDDFKIYISGDTQDTPEMRSLKDIEIAFLCMNQPFTMTVDQAISAVKEFKPKKVLPYHYKNADKTLADVERFCKMVSSSDTECVLLEWY